MFSDFFSWGISGFWYCIFCFTVWVGLLLVACGLRFVLCAFVGFWDIRDDWFVVVSVIWWTTGLFEACFVVLVTCVLVLFVLLGLKCAFAFWFVWCFTDLALIYDCYVVRLFHYGLIVWGCIFYVFAIVGFGFCFAIWFDFGFWLLI